MPRILESPTVLVATWNVNSLKVRLPRVLSFLEQHRPDVLCLQETKVTAAAFPHDALRAAGYHAADHSAGRWAGVAVLAPLDVPIEDVARGLPGEPDPEEARWVEATVGDMRVCSAYVINGRTPADPMFQVKLRFLEAAAARVAEIAAGPVAERIVAGDMNVAPEDRDVWDVTRVHGATHVTEDERSRLRALMEAGALADAFRVCEPEATGFTWWDYQRGAFHKNEGMRIDLLLVSPGLAERVAGCGIDRAYRKVDPATKDKPSDHAPLLLRLG